MCTAAMIFLMCAAVPANVIPPEDGSEGKRTMKKEMNGTREELATLVARASKVSLFNRAAFDDTTLGKQDPGKKNLVSTSQALSLGKRGLGKVQASTSQPLLAFVFGPGGLLFPYYMGVADELRALGLINASAPIGGASAGAIVASLVACRLTFVEMRRGLAGVVEGVRRGEKLNIALRRNLEIFLPEDAAELAQRHGLTISYLEVYPRTVPRIVTSWVSKQDLIETILASCNFPLFFSRWPLVRCRGAWAIDGLFSVERLRYGCPPLPGYRNVAVVALPRKETLFDASDLIQPGKQGMKLPDDVSESQWYGWRLSPAPDQIIDEMIKIGREHARLWDRQQGHPAVTSWHLPLPQPASKQQSSTPLMFRSLTSLRVPPLPHLLSLAKTSADAVFSRAVALSMAAFMAMVIAKASVRMICSLATASNALMRRSVWA